LGHAATRAIPYPEPDPTPTLRAATGANALERVGWRTVVVAAVGAAVGRSSFVGAPVQRRQRRPRRRLRRLRRQRRQRRQRRRRGRGRRGRQQRWRGGHLPDLGCHGTQKVGSAPTGRTKAGTRGQHPQHRAWGRATVRGRPGGKRPCASGAYRTQRAGTRSPHAQCGGPGAPRCLSPCQLGR